MAKRKQTNKDKGGEASRDAAAASPKLKLRDGGRGAKAMRDVVEAHVDRYVHLRPMLESMIERTTWSIDRIEWTDGHVEIRGWALAPRDGYCPASFTINGVEFEHIEYPRNRPDVGRVYWFRPGSELSEFVCRSSRVGRELFVAGIATFHFCDARTLQPFREQHGFYCSDPDAEATAFPQDDRRLRVHGNSDASSFRAQGSSAFVKLERTLNKTLGKGYEDFPRVLDWGCGCGRVARYFESRPGCAVVGIDIDQSNVAWCTENLPFASFSACQVDPPTGLADGAFDLIVGISVMTHLSEADRFVWLEELSRVADDGAIALLTVNGAAALCQTDVGVGSLGLWKQSGMLDVGVSLSAKDLSAEPDRYIDCFLTEEYIRDRWSHYFDVVDIIPGYIGNVQDLVVLRKSESKTSS